VIVGSLLLILAAVGLLVAGVLTGSNALVIASIVVVVISAVVLVVGVRRSSAPTLSRRDVGDDDAAGDGAALLALRRLDSRAGFDGIGVQAGYAPLDATAEVPAIPIATRRSGRSDREPIGDLSGSVVGATSSSDEVTSRSGGGTPSDRRTAVLDGPTELVIPVQAGSPPGGDEPDEERARALDPDDGPGYAPDTGYAPGADYSPDAGYAPGAGYASEAGYAPDADYAAGAGYTTDRSGGRNTDLDPLIAPAALAAEATGAIDDDVDEDPPDEPGVQVVSADDAARVARMDTDVFVIDGRPRYHTAACLHLVTREKEALPVSEAVELGFTPCSLCEPDRALLAATGRG